MPRHTCPLADPRQAPAPQCTVAAHCVDNSANCKCGVSHRGSSQLRAHNSHASSLDRGLRTPFSLARTTTPAAVSPRTFRVRHPSCSLTMRISSQRPRFESIPFLRTPEPVKSEHPLGSSPSPSGYVWNRLEPARGITTAIRPFSGCAPLNILSRFCAWCSLCAVEVCVSLSQCWSALIRLSFPRAQQKKRDHPGLGDTRNPARQRTTSS